VALGVATPDRLGLFVDVWLIKVADRIVEADRGLLDDQERQRVDRYCDPRHGAHFGGTRAAAKRLVGAYVGVTPEQVHIGRQRCPRCHSPEHGPPSIAQPVCGLRISLSRTGACAAIAVSSGRAVGVDIESTARCADIGCLARGTLSPAEFEYLMAKDGAEARQDAFLRCWTRKEAVLKGVGIGIAAELPDLDVQPHVTGAAVVSGSPVGTTRWEVQDFDVTRHVTGPPWWEENGGARIFVAVAQPYPKSIPITFRW
jgi:4'-phosphopantetheinyl transferase